MSRVCVLLVVSAACPKVGCVYMFHLIAFTMAKGSFNGVIKGKKGNTVFYELTNSNNKEKQGWREYKASIANPQSDGQIDQRVKMQAVNNLYRALKPIITRGWENHKYGDPSRRAFLKKALGASFEGPYIEKGSTLAVPIKNVPIMYGSLTPVVTVCPGHTQLPIFMNVIVGADADTGTVGGVSQVFINSGLAIEGDQVTIVFGWVDSNTNVVQYRTFSFIVDTSNSEPCPTALGMSIISETIEDEERLAIDSFEGMEYDASDYCCLCSISRDGDGQHLRSAAEFAMTSTFEAKFYGNAEQNAAAKRSYKKNTSASTNWQQVPGGGGYTPVVQSAFTRAGTEFTAVSITRKNVGGQNFEVIVDDGGVQYYIGSRPSAASQEIVYLSGTGSTASVDPSDLTTANSVNVFDSSNVAAGLRAWLIGKGIDATVLPV